MAALTEEQKVFIVQRVAMFDSPQTITNALKEEFGIDVPRQRIEDYDPSKRPNIPKKRKELHDATRAAFLEEAAKEPVAHRAVRIRRLARMADKAEGKGNFVLAKDLLEQIAKEVGDHYTNRRVLQGNFSIEELIRDSGGDGTDTGDAGHA